MSAPNLKGQNYPSIFDERRQKDLAETAWRLFLSAGALCKNRKNWELELAAQDMQRTINLLTKRLAGMKVKP